MCVCVCVHACSCVYQCPHRRLNGCMNHTHTYTYLSKTSPPHHTHTSIQNIQPPTHLPHHRRDLPAQRLRLGTYVPDYLGGLQVNVSVNAPIEGYKRCVFRGEKVHNTRVCVCVNRRLQAVRFFFVCLVENITHNSCLYYNKHKTTTTTTENPKHRATSPPRPAAASERA